MIKENANTYIGKDPSGKTQEEYSFENTIKMAGTFHFELLRFIGNSDTELSIYEKRYQYNFSDDSCIRVMHFRSRHNEIVVDARKLFRLIVDARECYDSFVYVINSKLQQIELEKKHRAELEKATLKISGKRNDFECDWVKLKERFNK